MFGFAGKLAYPLLGALVLGTYVYTVQRGIEPLEVSSEKRALPKGAQARSGGGYRRSHTTVIFFGGFGGK